MGGIGPASATTHMSNAAKGLSMNSLIGLGIAFVGVFAVIGAVSNWAWFFESRKGRSFVKLFGRGGARVFYVLLGVFLIGLGLLGAFGVIDMSS